MNYLAHLYLSQNQSGLLVGNFIGDSVKGRSWQDLPNSISEGVLMHRHIDSYTDQHEICKEVIGTLRPYFGRWTGVALDMIWDYFLAYSWAKWDDRDLKSYTENVYEVVRESSQWLPSKSMMILDHMQTNNWLLNYATLEGMDWAFKGMSRRIKHENTLFNGRKAIEENRVYLDEKFNLFFPQLVHECEMWLHGRK